MPIEYVFLLFRHDLDAGLPVGKMHDGDDTRLMEGCLGSLGVREAVGDRNMAVAFGVDTLHLTAEELTMGGGVTELVDGDVVMDHLMEDGVLDEGFGQVNAGVDTEDEVFVAEAAKETLLATGESEFAQKAFGVGQFDGDRRKGTGKETGIKLVKAGLDIGNRWDHANVRRTNV